MYNIHNKESINREKTETDTLNTNIKDIKKIIYNNEHMLSKNAMEIDNINNVLKEISVQLDSLKRDFMINRQNYYNCDS